LVILARKWDQAPVLKKCVVLNLLEFHECRLVPADKDFLYKPWLMLDLFSFCLGISTFASAKAAEMLSSR